MNHDYADRPLPKLQAGAVRRLIADPQAAERTVALLTDLRRRVVGRFGDFERRRLDGASFRLQRGDGGSYRNWIIRLDPAHTHANAGFPPHDALQCVFMHEYLHAVDHALTLQGQGTKQLFSHADMQMDALKNGLEPVLKLGYSLPFERWKYMKAGHAPKRAGLLGLDGGEVRIHGLEHLSVLTEYALYFPEWLGAVKHHLGADYRTPLYAFWGGPLAEERPEVRARLDREFEMLGVTEELIRSEVIRLNPGMRRALHLPAPARLLEPRQ